MKTLYFTGFIVLFASFSNIFSDEIPKLADLTQKFNAAQENLSKGFRTQQSDLTSKMVNSWLQYEQQLKQAGASSKLEASIKLREAFLKSKEFPEVTDTEIQKLKTVYIKESARLKESESRQKADIEKKYYAALKLMADQFQRQRKMDAAAEVRSVLQSQGEITNSIGMKFRAIPITGGPTDGRRILFSIWETRNQDFGKYVKDSRINWDRGPGFPTEDGYPAAGASYKQAIAFCEWLTKKEQSAGLIRSQDLYRLPTDHEWSCAVGIGSREKFDDSLADKSSAIKVYPWGKYFPPEKEDGNYNWRPDDGFPDEAPVGSFPPNQFGLYDMGGNLMEFCIELYPDMKKPNTDFCVVRDAPYSFGNPAHLKTKKESGFLMSSHRARLEVDKVRARWNGFRIVLESGR